MYDYCIVEANLRAAMRFFGEATGTGAIEDADGVQSVFSGLDYGVFNIGMLNRPLSGPADTLESRLAHCKKYFEQRTRRWSFWLCEDFVPAGGRRQSRWAFSAAGLRQISQAPGFMTLELKPPTRALPEIECVPVTDQASRDVFGGITTVSFDIPVTVSREVYSHERAWRGDYRGFVAKVKGRPVGVIAIVAAAESLGIYSFATAPEDRRRGYGEALLRAAVERERERTGIKRLVLQSTEAGQGLYQRLGFQEVAHFSVYLTQ